MAGTAGTRVAVVAPGQRYSADAPLLMYAGLAVERRGGAVHRISWEVPGFSDAGSERAWVIAQVSEAVEAAVAAASAAGPRAGAPPVLVGKSLGSLAAPVAADRGLPAVWLTPVLTDEATVAALRRSQAPCLLVGGTADALWDGRVARSLSPRVLEIAGADHGMLVPGRLAESAAVLGRVATAVEDFLDGIWPRSGPREPAGSGHSR